MDAQRESLGKDSSTFPYAMEPWVRYSSSPQSYVSLPVRQKWMALNHLLCQGETRMATQARTVAGTEEVNAGQSCLWWTLL